MRLKQRINAHRAGEILSWTFAGSLRTNSLDFHCSDLLPKTPEEPSRCFRIKQRFDRTALVHRTVSLCRLIHRQSQVKDLAGVDLPVPNQLDEPGQVTAHRCGSTVEMNVGKEQLLTVQFDTVWNADVTYVATRARRFGHLQRECRLHYGHNFLHYRCRHQTEYRDYRGPKDQICRRKH